MRLIIVSLLLSLVLSSCSFGGAIGPTQYFVLLDQTDLTPECVTNNDCSKSCSKSIVVKDVRSSKFLSTESIRFRRSPSTRGTYQLAKWTEPPPKRLTSLIASQLRSSGLFRSVSEISNGVRGEILLDLELLEFVHSIDDSSSSVEVKLQAQLIDLTSRKIVSYKIFGLDQPVEIEDAHGAVAAFDVAVSEILKQLQNWVLEGCISSFK